MQRKINGKYIIASVVAKVNSQLNKYSYIPLKVDKAGMINWKFGINIETGAVYHARMPNWRDEKSEV